MTKLGRFMVWTLGLGLLGAGCADQNARNQPPQRAQMQRAVSPPDNHAMPEPLAPAARAILKQRMVSHARDMDKLVSAIMLLDYPTIALRANEIAADVNLSRPLTSDATELNASLPETFFQRQDELRREAKELATAASALAPYRVADAYGKLSEGCVRCHAEFRPRG